MGFAKSYSLKCSLHKWAWCGAARKSARLNCINLIHFRLTARWLHGSSCIVIPGVVSELLQFMATMQAGIVNFFVDHTYTQFTEESKMATELTPQTDVTSGKVTWLMENLRQVSASLRKIKSIKNPIKHFLSFFISLNLKLVTHLSIISMVILPLTFKGPLALLRSTLSDWHLVHSRIWYVKGPLALLRTTLLDW